MDKKVNTPSAKPCFSHRSNKPFSFPTNSILFIRCYFSQCDYQTNRLTFTVQNNPHFTLILKDNLTNEQIYTANENAFSTNSCLHSAMRTFESDSSYSAIKTRPPSFITSYIVLQMFVPISQNLWLSSSIMSKTTCFNLNPSNVAIRFYRRGSLSVYQLITNRGVVFNLWFKEKQ